MQLTSHRRSTNTRARLQIKIKKDRDREGRYGASTRAPHVKSVDRTSVQSESVSWPALTVVDRNEVTSPIGRGGRRRRGLGSRTGGRGGQRAAGRAMERRDRTGRRRPRRRRLRSLRAAALSSGAPALFVRAARARPDRPRVEVRAGRRLDATSDSRRPGIGRQKHARRQAKQAGTRGRASCRPLRRSAEQREKTSGGARRWR